MKIKDVNLDLIKDMLSVIPDEMDLDAIRFVNNDIILDFSASYSIIRKQTTQQKANELYQLIASIDRKHKKDEIKGKGSKR